MWRGGGPDGRKGRRDPRNTSAHPIYGEAKFHLSKVRAFGEVEGPLKGVAVMVYIGERG